jgi:biotin-(acetyl-CoA carboxylase) ligase
MSTLSFPPLMAGQAVTGQEDPFETACAMAALGCDAGTVVYNLQADRLRAAIVFAPEVMLEEALAMLPLCGVGFQNALGALAPPEVAVHLTWAGGIKVNGAKCGGFSIATSDKTPEAQPDWLVVGLGLPLLLTGQEPGTSPDATALHEEGCADVDPGELVESWARHVLNWIARWEEGGKRALHDEWRGLADGIGEPVQVLGETGTFVGVDERFGMLLRDETGTRLIPLSRLLED